MVSTSVWIAIAVIAVLVVAALVFGLVRYRRRRISLASPTAVDRDTTKPIDRSGGYTASSGITFSQSAPPAAPPETPERIDTDGLPAVGDDATIPRDAPKRPIADVQPEEVARIWSINVDGVLWGIQAGAAKFRELGRPGKIINASSIAGHDGFAMLGVIAQASSRCAA